MLEGWYCRSIANAANNEERAREESKYKAQYRFLKRKLKHLVYENECFQDQLRTAQKRLLSVTKDRSFLLDRLLQYENGMSTTDSEDTDSSDEEVTRIENNNKKRKPEPSVTTTPQNNISSSGKVSSTAKKKRTAPVKLSKSSNQPIIPSMSMASNMSSDGHMTPEEVERHLQSRQSYMELVPERAPPTVPTEMFSNEPSLDSFVYFSESNDIGEQETSPSNIEEELSVDMITD